MENKEKAQPDDPIRADAVSNKVACTVAHLKFPFSSLKDDLDTDELKVTAALQGLLEKRLYMYQSVDMKLPPTVLTRLEESGIQLANLFSAPPETNEHELVELARTANGRPQGLSSYQRRAIYKNATFEVESAQWPGRSHVWRVSRLLQKGSEPAWDSLCSGLALALRELIDVAPSMLFGWPDSKSSQINANVLTYAGVNPLSQAPQRFHTKYSVPHLMYQFIMSFTEVVHLTVGLPIRADPPSYVNTPKQMEDLKTFLEATNPYEYIAKDVMKLTLDVHLLAIPAGERQKVQQRVSDICHTFHLRWDQQQKVEYSAANELCRKRFPLASLAELRQHTQHILYEKQLLMLCDMMVKDSELNGLFAGAGAAVMNIARVLHVLDRERQRFEAERQTAIQNFTTELKARSPLFCRVSEWREFQIKDFTYRWDREHRWALQTRVINRVVRLGQPVAEGADGGTETSNITGVGTATLAAPSTFARLLEEKTSSSAQHIAIDVTAPTPARSATPSVGSATDGDPDEDVALRSLPLPPPLTEAYLLRHGADFAKLRARKCLEQAERTSRPPKRVIEHEVYHWRPSSWKVSQDEAGRYTSQQFRIWRVSTGYFGWQVINFFVSLAAWLNNCGYFALTAATVSFYWLVSCYEFQLFHDVNPETGRPYRGGHLFTPWICRISKLAQHTLASRTKFEQSPDQGLLGKACTRPFNWVWNWVFKFFFGTIIILLIFPLGCAFCFAFSSAMLVSVLLWVPMARIVYAVFQLFVLDVTTPRRFGFKGLEEINNPDMPTSVAPLISLVLHVLFCLFMIVLALFRMMITPLVAIVITVASLIWWFIGRIFDTIFYVLLIYPLGRIPAGDSFLVRRIAGPGLSADYFYSLKPQDVLLLLQIQLEKSELALLKRQLEAVIQKPLDARDVVSSRVLAPFGATLGNHPSLHDSTRKLRDQLSGLMTERQAEYVRVFRPLERALPLLRLSAADLAEVLQDGEQLVRSFHLTRIFPKHGRDQFWQHQDAGVNEDDWRGLTRSILSDVSPSLLVSLEETDNAFSLQVQHVDLQEYFRMIIFDDVHDDLERVTPVLQSSTTAISKSAPNTKSLSLFSAQDFCLGHRKRLASHYPFTASFAWDYLDGPDVVDDTALVRRAKTQQKSSVSGLQRSSTAHRTTIPHGAVRSSSSWQTSNFQVASSSRP